MKTALSFSIENRMNHNNEVRRDDDKRLFILLDFIEDVSVCWCKTIFSSSSHLISFSAHSDSIS